MEENDVQVLIWLSAMDVTYKAILIEKEDSYAWV